MVNVKNPDEIISLVTSGPMEQKRIFSIVAHIDHGKTTTADYLLERAGLMRPEDAGAVLMTDSDAEEQERGITIFTSVVLLSFEYKGTEYIFQINDTPGHISFTGEVSRALRASDGCIILVDALEGVMTQTETNIRLAVGEELCKPVLFINKVDRLISELRLEPKETYARIDRIIDDVNGLIEQIQPEGVDWTVSFAKNSVAIGSAKHGWGFTYELLQENGIAPTKVFEKYREGDIEWLRKTITLDESLLRMVVTHLPDPLTAAKYRIPRIWRDGDLDSEYGKALLEVDRDGPLLGMITKIFIDPKSFRATLIGRVFSGTLERGETIYLLNQRKKHRIKRLGVMEVTDLLDIDEIPAGNLFAIFGFICPAGETFVHGSAAELVDKGDVTGFESISYACEAVVSRSITPEDPQDLAKLGNVVSKWLQADPTAQFSYNDESKEYVLSGIDPLQIEILTKRINAQVKIKVGEPIIVYREHITQKSKEYYTKSSNGHNRIKLYIEILDEETRKLARTGAIWPEQNNKERARILRDKAGWDAKEARKIWDVFNECVFVDATKGLQRLDRIKSYVVGAFRDWVSSCVLAKEPAQGLKVVMTDATVHVDPAHTGYNEIASMVFSGLSLAFLSGKPQLFEPIQRVDIKTPAGTEGNIITILTQHRGFITEIVPEGNFVRVKGKIPASETVNIADEFRSASQGRAFFGYEFDGFEPVPAALQQQLILEIRRRKGMPEEMPSPKSWERFIYIRS
ncbi:MAG: elongation factor EF-2 [Promethearchaeota archaeon]